MTTISVRVIKKVGPSWKWVWAVVLLALWAWTWSRSVPKPLLSKSYFVTSWTLPTQNTSQVKTILFWTDFFSSMDGWQEFYGLPGDCKCQCNYNFAVDKSKSQYAEADAVVFNARDLYADPQLPPGRRSQQLWILHNTEPPWWTWLEMHKYNGVFNLTSFVRKDSDIPTYYGRLKEKLVPFLADVSYYDEKTEFAAWAVSNCYTQNQREYYISQLRQYIPVNVYGKCGTQVCRKKDDACSKKIRKHKFYLAFENGNCRDYITEKFWNALNNKVLPVVMGDSAIYYKVAPPGSYINSRDFKSARELADYMKLVGANKTLYDQYFRWRKSYSVEDNNDYWCDVCCGVHNLQGRGSVYHDLQGWFQQDYCPGYNVSILTVQKKIPFALNKYTPS